MKPKTVLILLNHISENKRFVTQHSDNYLLVGVINSNSVRAENKESDDKLKSDSPSFYKPRDSNVFYFNPLGHLQEILGD